MNKDLPTSGKGLVPGSRFGFAIANLGDLQQDGFEDFAVGAPYDGNNHEGAIYIYRGAINLNFESMFTIINFFSKNLKTFLCIDPQIIRPSDFKLKTGDPFKTGFGYTFSKEQVDVDSNNFPDFAVGIPFVEKAVLFKTRQTWSFTEVSYLFPHLPSVQHDRNSKLYNIHYI